MAINKQELSNDTIAKIIVQILIVGLVLSFMLGYMQGRHKESIVNLNELVYTQNELLYSRMEVNDGRETKERT